MRPLLCAPFVLLSFPATAQEAPPQGIAFAQAEEGTWLCRHDKAEEAMSCALEHCAEQAPGQECFATAWCFPGGWAGYMTIWLPDFHTTQVLCGVATETALEDAFRAICAAEDTAESCDMVGVIDPEGHERAYEGESFAGGAAPPEPETSADATDPEALESGAGAGLEGSEEAEPGALDGEAEPDARP